MMKSELLNLLVVIWLQITFKIVNASVIFEDCGSAYELHSVNIAGCGFRLPCHVTLGEDVQVKLEFHADFLSRKLDQDVVININHINLRTPVQPELCDIVDCPVTTDAVTSFNSVMSVPKNMALNQRGYLKWSIYNEDELLVLCYSVLVQTQSPLQKFLRQHFPGDLRKASEVHWMQKAGERNKWQALGEAYVQQWTAAGG